ncbi:MAG: transglutaminase domain-containing protein [Bacteroidales bacterium]|nr:transglutaminase domain-containing protein [Bacteroidales bacterium]
MRRVFSVIIVLAAIITGWSCSDKSMINDKDYSTSVEIKFIERKELAANRSEQLFGVFSDKLQKREEEALKFLYAYMPLNDLADYDGDFFLANVQTTFKAKDSSPWGKDIPEDIFLHYVLPVRVNNENLDSFRIKYYKEINARLSSIKSIKEAALEVNHWCHEKVTYQPADIRTSAPISTILSSRGRCGEESTFVVAALRTVGIPARQVYTPRWAHSDDNHAWVEVWSDDGNWYYLGACEPEPVFDKGWFTEPARRAMLIHTKAFGFYNGIESTIVVSDNYAEINTLSKYALTKDIFVKVTDQSGNPVENSIVEFQLYNYAEFYPLATVNTDVNGLAQFKTGLGDLLVWARKGDFYDFEKITIEEVDTLYLEISDRRDNKTRIEYDLTAPLKRKAFEGLSKEVVKENRIRLKEEDRVREEYIDSWISEDVAVEIAVEYGYDTVKFKSVISRSMGNYAEIIDFLKTGYEVDPILAIKIVELVADKDLRDTHKTVLEDHLYAGRAPVNEITDTNTYYNYVLNPRIANEIIKPWRSFIQDYFDEATIKLFSETPGLIATWIDENIKINLIENYYNVPITPRGIMELGVTDPFSRDILSVAICRSLGIPSRLEPGTVTPQFLSDKGWRNFSFGEKSVLSDIEKASIILKHSGDLPVPEYYTHFTIARFEDGKYKTLEYDYNRRIDDFSDGLELNPGRYMVVTGNRVDDSEVLASIEFFTIESGEKRDFYITLRDNELEDSVIGFVSADSEVEIEDANVKLSQISQEGLIIAWIEHDKEPTKHIFNDIPLLKSEFDTWPGSFLFLSNPSDKSPSYDPLKFKGLPERSVFGFDTGLNLLRTSLPETEVNMVQFPVIIYVDAEGQIKYVSEGYRIGIGEQLLKRVK